MVQVGTGGVGTRFISKRYPVTEGVTLGTTKLEGKQTNLVATELRRLEEYEKELLDG